MSEELQQQAVISRRQCDAFVRSYYGSCELTGGRPNWADDGMRHARGLFARLWPKYEDIVRIGHEAGMKPGTIPRVRVPQSQRYRQHIQITPTAMWTKFIAEVAKQKKIDELAQVLMRESVPYHPADLATDIDNALQRHGIRAKVKGGQNGYDEQWVHIRMPVWVAEEFKRFLRTRVR